jgi:hypothetical protein
MNFVVIVKVNKRVLVTGRAGGRVGRFGKCSVKRIEEKYILCRICSTHYKGWLVYVETLFDYGVPRVPLYHHQICYTNTAMADKFDIFLRRLAVTSSQVSFLLYGALCLMLVPFPCCPGPGGKVTYRKDSK